MPIGIPSGIPILFARHGGQTHKFGCAFVPHSDFYNQLAQDPFSKLIESGKQDILSHMRHYHGGPLGDDPSIEALAIYVPKVFEEISGNLE